MIKATGFVSFVDWKKDGDEEVNGGTISGEVVGITGLGRFIVLVVEGEFSRICLPDVVRGEVMLVS